MAPFDVKSWILADFTNPYGHRSTTQADSDTSSDRLSQFGTAREYNDFDMQTDLWYDDKDDGPYMTPSFGGVDPFGCPSEDKFVMTSGMATNLSRNPFSFNRLLEESEENDHHLEFPSHSHKIASDVVVNGQVKDCHQLDEKKGYPAGVELDLGRIGSRDCEDFDSNLKEVILSELGLRIAKQRLSDTEILIEGNEKDMTEELDGSRSIYETDKQDLLLVNSCKYNFVANDEEELVKITEEPRSAINEQESTILDEIPYGETNEDDYEVFNLRIIHRKNRFVTRLSSRS